MVTTRTLDRRRSAILPGPAFRRRRRSRAQLAQLADRAARHLSAAPVVRIVIGMVGVLSLVTIYLVMDAEITAASYQIQQRQAAQQQLEADLEQLRYQEAVLTGPARIDQEAQAAGLTRVPPSHYLPYAAVHVDLAAAIGPPPPDSRPPWRRLVSFLLRSVGGPSAEGS